MKSYFVCVAAAALCLSPAYTQNILEHAAAAAGATIGTGAGKMLSNGIDKILGKAAETGSNAAKPAPARPATTPIAPPSPVSNRAPAFSQAPPGQPGTPQHARSRRSAAVVDPDKPVFAAPEAPVSMYAPAAPQAIEPPPPSPEDFAKVKEGASRADVLAALGTPSSRITIPDDGHLIEIFSYSDGRRRVGSVRIDNGAVVTVSAAQ
jgi:hypothetical protein